LSKRWWRRIGWKRRPQKGQRRGDSLSLAFNGFMGSLTLVNAFVNARGVA
jgi:hypothetical protein